MRPFEEILAIDSAAAFDCAALELFRFQAERCGVYREYLAEIGVDPAAVRRVDEIPMLPIEFFKWRDVYCGDTEPQIVFTSSNTGQSVASHHMMASTALYEAACLAYSDIMCGAVCTLSVREMSWTLRISWSATCSFRWDLWSISCSA